MCVRICVRMCVRDNIIMSLQYSELLIWTPEMRTLLPVQSEMRPPLKTGHSVTGRKGGRIRGSPV